MGRIVLSRRHHRRRRQVDKRLARPICNRYSDRFLLGSDTWINERWFGYDTIFKEYRGWLAQLPAEQARRIAKRQRVAAVRTRARD